MTDRIPFRSSEPPEVLAAWLATLIYHGWSVGAGAPFLGIGGGMWELSTANDHKLDVRGPGEYAYRDRYHPPERMARIRQALSERPGVEMGGG